jgi:hypothetical protein
MKKTTIAFAVILLSGCSAQQLNSGAEKVRFLQADPKGCKYLGEATGNQGNFFTGGFTSNSNMETGARNTMKNKAAAMGGNAIVLLTNRAGQTGSAGLGSGSLQQTNVVLTGTVYDCPESAF